MVLMMWFPFHLIPSDSDSCQPVPKSFQSQTENSSYQGFVFVKKSTYLLLGMRIDQEYVFCLIRGCSQKVGARKIAKCHFQVPVLKVRSQFRSQLKNFYKEPIFSNWNWMIACTWHVQFHVQMLMSVLYFSFSFRFHHQKQKDLYNLLQ